jgi:hypothetical protein
LKIAPTVSLVVNVTVQLLGPAAVIGPVFAQLDDHPPNAAPVAGAVNVTVVPTGYVATQTEAPDPAAGPQLITFGVPVAEGAVTSQLVVFKPSL